MDPTEFVDLTLPLKRRGNVFVLVGQGAQVTVAVGRHRMLLAGGIGEKTGAFDSAEPCPVARDLLSLIHI